MNLMNATNRTAMVIALAAVVVLLLLGSKAMIGTMWSGGMMRDGVMNGISWMWIPALLTLGLGILVGWSIFNRR